MARSRSRSRDSAALISDVDGDDEPPRVRELDYDGMRTRLLIDVDSAARESQLLIDLVSSIRHTMLDAALTFDELGFHGRCARRVGSEAAAVAAELARCRRIFDQIYSRLLGDAG